MFNIGLEQLAEFNRMNLENAVRLAQLHIKNTERLAQLNLDMVKETLNAAQSQLKEIPNIADYSDLSAWRTNAIERTVERTVDYSRNCYDAMAANHEELAKLAQESFSVFNKNMVSTIEKATKSAPAGSELAVNAMKSTLVATNAAIDSLNKVGRQVVELADASVKAAANATAGAMKTSATKKAA